MLLETAWNIFHDNILKSYIKDLYIDVTYKSNITIRNYF